MTQLIAPPAAVVGGSVVAFASGLPASHREDIYMSTAFAQNATRTAFNNGLSGDWFEYYRNQLKFLGWDVPKPETLLPMQNSLMGRQAMRCISTRLGEAFSQPMRRALEQMERNALALKVFDSTSLGSEGGCFQMIPCVMNGPNKVDMGIYHRQFQIRRDVSRFLFVEDQTLVYNSIEQMALITFNTLHYAQFRDKVKKSVISHSLEYLINLEI
ncbi:hypothetical protein [Pseudomonas sp. B21-048]|uniref:hypothetical protein n=1 Tax=Pseudomonas sp. B21-048 TaxID=2895490 RepID=UPI00215E1CBF|nr:hypothetical protein [Pseudomonas sp. B21-048]UVK99387.1 hypothetical protein LOY56_02935 [Pseudomonas sp. B21-048]